MIAIWKGRHPTPSSVVHGTEESAEYACIVVSSTWLERMRVGIELTLRS